MAIAAFEGWNDAAEAASGVVNHLGIAWESTPIAAIDPDDFYDFQVNRPVIEVVAGKTERLVWPTTRLSLARPLTPGCPATSCSCTASSRTCAGAGSPTSSSAG